MKTALITGATEGIGLEFARLFARKGVNLILIARTESRLELISKELSELNVNVITYAKDLSKIENAVSIFEDIKSKNICVDYLINNAGFGTNGKYIDLPWQKEQDMMNLNMVTLAYLTKQFAQEMVKRDFGRILNVASTGAFQPGPHMAVYCATKAFVLSFSEAVNSELKGSNVSVSTLCPGVTDTQFHIRAYTESTNMSKKLSHATPQKVATYGYRLMMKGKAMGVYGLINKLIISANRILPRSVVTSVTKTILK